MFELTGKVGVVTGGGSGIGLATVRRFAAAGARVVIGDLTDQTALAAEVGGTFVRTDVARDADVAALMAAAIEVFERLDVVVNCAGVAEGNGPMTEEADEPYLRQFKVNTLGVVHGIKHAAELMTGGGSIVNVASITATMALPRNGSYAVSKWGVVGATMTAAVELGGHGIRVNCVCPALVDTPMIRGDEGPAVRGLMAYQHTVPPLPRLIRAEEVAALIHFLASDESAAITGQVIAVDAGQSAGPSLEFFDRLATDGETP